MAQYPDSDVVLVDIVQKMVRDAVEVAATEATAIEVKEPRILNCFLNPELKLGEKIVTKLA